MTRAYDNRLFQRLAVCSQVIDVREHDHAVLDRHADQGDKAHRRGDVERHAS